MYNLKKQHIELKYCNLCVSWKTLSLSLSLSLSLYIYIYIYIYMNAKTTKWDMQNYLNAVRVVLVHVWWKTHWVGLFPYIIVGYPLGSNPIANLYINLFNIQFISYVEFNDFITLNQAKMGKCPFRTNYTAFCPISQTN